LLHSPAARSAAGVVARLKTNYGQMKRQDGYAKALQVRLPPRCEEWITGSGTAGRSLLPWSRPND
jgi:hypothetical protein